MSWRIQFAEKNERHDNEHQGPLKTGAEARFWLSESSQIVFDPFTSLFIAFDSTRRYEVLDGCNFGSRDKRTLMLGRLSLGKVKAFEDMEYEFCDWSDSDRVDVMGSDALHVWACVVQG